MRSTIASPINCRRVSRRVAWASLSAIAPCFRRRAAVMTRPSRRRCREGWVTIAVELDLASRGVTGRERPRQRDVGAGCHPHGSASESTAATRSRSAPTTRLRHPLVSPAATSPPDRIRRVVGCTGSCHCRASTGGSERSPAVTSGQSNARLICCDARLCR
jgi:hypothetical protein